jgi:hypothetical protein
LLVEKVTCSLSVSVAAKTGDANTSANAAARISFFIQVLLRSVADFYMGVIKNRTNEAKQK